MSISKQELSLILQDELRAGKLLLSGKKHGLDKPKIKGFLRRVKQTAKENKIKLKRK